MMYYTEIWWDGHVRGVKVSEPHWVQNMAHEHMSIALDYFSGAVEGNYVHASNVELRVVRDLGGPSINAYAVICANTPKGWATPKQYAQDKGHEQPQTVEPTVVLGYNEGE